MMTISQRAALKRAKPHKSESDQGDSDVAWVAIPLLLVIFVEQIARRLA